MIRTAVTVLVLAAVAGQVRADAILKIESGGSAITIVDNGAGDLVSATGAIVWVGSINNWILNVTSGTTKPFNGVTFTWPEMHLGSDSTSSGAGSITISFTDTDWVAPSSVTGFYTSLGGVANGTISGASYYDAANAPFGITPPAMATLGPYTGAFGETVGFNLVPAAGKYSLTMTATITHTAARTSSFDMDLQPVPEPGTLALMGAAGLALALIRRRRKAS